MADSRPPAQPSDSPGTLRHDDVRKAARACRFPFGNTAPFPLFFDYTGEKHIWKYHFCRKHPARAALKETAKKHPCGLNRGAGRSVIFSGLSQARFRRRRSGPATGRGWRQGDAEPSPVSLRSEKFFHGLLSHIHEFVSLFKDVQKGRMALLMILGHTGGNGFPDFDL